MKKININDTELIQILASKRVKDGQDSGKYNRCKNPDYIATLETFARVQVGHELEVAYKILNAVKELTGEDVIILGKE